MSGNAAGHESSLATAWLTTLEELVPGVRVDGVIASGAVDVVAVKWHGSNCLTLTFGDTHGVTGEAVLGRDKERRLRIAQAGRSHPLDGDAESWHLVAEALRIHFAALFDPMLAVVSSDLEPLPHQLEAVSGELPPRTPLRFLQADHPGAGKTITAGLYVMELVLRGDLSRCLIVAPGSLVEQGQDELYDKLNLRFELLTRSMIDAAVGGSAFDETHPLLIARMDRLSRSEELLADLERCDWDLAVVDDAHRMPARYLGGELKTTKRYQLGQLLARVTRHLLLMTSTPHAGKQEDFQPLFPERRADTVPYGRSTGEHDLYEAVTRYVRDEMNRAERLKGEGEGRRGNTVGFALTVLQRRLASSPEAILKSLERRRCEMTAGGSARRCVGRASWGETRGRDV